MDVASNPRPAGERDPAIEGLRGLAALVVLYHHTMLSSVGGWSPAPAWTWLVSAPAAVLVFFVLSGYVIGLTYGEHARERDLRDYLWRRALRLVPINCAGVLLGCAIADSLDGATVLGNLAFLENFSDYAGHWVLVLRENPNLWSLNYEVVFYLGFALLWRTRTPLPLVIVSALTVGLAGWYQKIPPTFVACYAFGALFWLSGLALAWRGQPATEAGRNWPTVLLLAALTWKLQGGEKILLPLDPAPPRFSGPSIKLYYLDFLPVCLWLVASVAGRAFRGFTAVRVTAALIPLFGLGMRFARDSADRFETWALVGLYALVLALWRWRVPVTCFRWCAPLGLISYAVYAAARPIQFTVFRVGQSLPPGAAGFLLCALVATTLTFAVAWYLERRLQPALRRAFAGRAAIKSRASVHT